MKYFHLDVLQDYIQIYHLRVTSEKMANYVFPSMYRQEVVNVLGNHLGIYTLVITFSGEKIMEIHTAITIICSIMLPKCQECNTFCVTNKTILHFASWMDLKLWP